jgi:hypothetical protein
MSKDDRFVSWKELAASTMIEVEALIRILERKGWLLKKRFRRSQITERGHDGEAEWEGRTIYLQNIACIIISKIEKIFLTVFSFLQKYKCYKIF